MILRAIDQAAQEIASPHRRVKVLVVQIGNLAVHLWLPGRLKSSVSRYKTGAVAVNLPLHRK